MEPYIDYEFYKNEYHGQTIPESDFLGLALEASYYLKRITFNRIETPSDDVKLATCAVAEVVYKYQDIDGISSETVGNYTVFYGSAKRDGVGFSVENRKLEAAKMYLLHTGLLYAGVRQ